MTPSEAIKRLEAILVDLHAMPADYHVIAADAVNGDIQVNARTMDREFGAYQPQGKDLRGGSFYRIINRNGVQWCALYPVADYFPAEASDIGRQTGDFGDDVEPLVDPPHQQAGA